MICQLLAQEGENNTIVYRGFTRVTLYWKQGHLCVEIHTNGDDCLIPDNRKRDTAFMRHVLATNLLSIRKVRNMSQEDMEEATDVSANEIGKIEREETSPGLDTITALALGLGLEVKQLLDSDLGTAAVSLNRNGGSE